MQKRFEELDLFRGVAIICMIVYHILFVLNYFGVEKVNLYFPTMEFFTWIVRFDFLALVGVGMVISYYRVLSKGRGRWAAIFRQWKRGAMVGLCALIVSGVTYLYVPENFVRFGILHIIAVSILFWSFFVEWKWVVLALSLLSFWIGGWFAWMGLSGLDFTMVPFGYFFRDMLWNIEALDYFPFFPWIGMAGFGVFIGQIFYPRGVKRFEWNFLPVDGQVKKTVCFLGRHSLIVYVVHVPLIMAVLWVFGLLKI